MYKIEKELDKFYVYEIDEYKTTLAFIGVFNTEAEAKSAIAEATIKNKKDPKKPKFDKKRF